MKKKILSLLLCVCMAATMFAGCGNSDNKNTETTTQTEENTQDISTEQTTESTEFVETEQSEVVETESEEEINVLITTEHNKWVQEFLQLYLGCYVNYYLGNNDVEPVNITTMLEYPDVIGRWVMQDGFRVPLPDYSDDLFMLKVKGGLYSYIAKCNTGDKKRIEYKTEVVLQEGSINNSFRYYDDTEQKIISVHKVNFYVDDNLLRDDLYFASQWYYDVDEWIMDLGYLLTESDYRPYKGTIIEKELVDEDEQKAIEDIQGTSLQSAIDSYSGLGGMYALFYLNGSDVPYCANMNDVVEGILNVYHYENGELVNCIEESGVYGQFWISINPVKNCISINESVSPETYYDVYEYKNGKFEKIHHLVYGSLEGEYRYSIDEESVTGEEFDSLQNELALSKDISFSGSIEEALTRIDKPSSEPDGNDYDVDAEVEQIREWYYTTQDNLDSLLHGGYPDNINAYFDGANAAKVTVPSGYSGDSASKEYFFHNKQLYFIFAVDNEGEHRFYFKNGDLIRYINPGKETFNYGDAYLANIEARANALYQEATELESGMVNSGN